MSQLFIPKNKKPSEYTVGGSSCRIRSKSHVEISVSTGLPHTACRGIDKVSGMEWCGKLHPHLRSHSGSTHPQCHIVNPILTYFAHFFQSPLCLLPSAVAHIHHRPCEAFLHPAPLSACCKPVGWGSNGSPQKSRCPPHKNAP